MRIDVKEYVQEVKNKLRVDSTKPNKVKKLLIIQIGNNEASNRYINGKIKDCEDVGCQATLIKFPEGVRADVIYSFLKVQKGYYHGIILQEPANITETDSYTKKDILNLIEPNQDVDGFRIDSKYKPCTPLGIIRFLKSWWKLENFKGKTVAVVGKGKLVGKPLVPMLMEEGATVISCNSSTADLGSMTRLADIVVTCTGVPALITRDMLKDGAAVIDAGIAFNAEGKICGDCDPALYDDENIYVTTVPGGVGLLTRVTLLENLSEGGFCK